MREPNTLTHQMQRFVGTMSNFPPAAALPLLADFYQRRFEYGAIAPPPPPPPAPIPAFFHSMIPIAGTTLHSMPLMRSYSTPSPSSIPSTLVNSNQSSSAFIPLIPVARQHSVDITPPPSSSSSTPVLLNNTNSSTRRLSEDDDSEIDIETLPSPSKTTTTMTRNEYTYRIYLDNKRLRYDDNETDNCTPTNK